MKPPQPDPCRFLRCWIGFCGETDRSRCRHKTGNCRCGRPAISECGETIGAFVCGELICHYGNCAKHGGGCDHKT